MKKGQIWIETVIYTLIGLVLIGLVLAFATPKINEFKDKAIIDQTIDSLKGLDSKISEVIQEGPGNVRNVEFGMKRGDLYFDLTEDKIYYVIEDSRVLYSEPGIETEIGRIKILTEEGSINNKITLTLYYDSDLVFQENALKKFTAAPTPYRFSLSNKGFENDREVIQIEEFG
ncbi:hypothetical protein AUJ84_00505 [Candidatus Pacearchaeota archaeon CG1_02_32_132]|nr:MAG: hypothetical protein AUJ84_00505 [Candidatus Pacearchaeota archaeon CG1_02_32_132]